MSRKGRKGPRRKGIRKCPYCGASRRCLVFLYDSTRPPNSPPFGAQCLECSVILEIKQEVP